MFSRRSFIRQGAALSVLGSSLQGALQSANPKAKAKSIIFLHQFGGPSQMDTFDLKPNAPDAYRGPLKGISSVVPSMPVGELLPNMAKVMDRVTIVRSVHHEMKNHNSAAYYSLTGYSPAQNIKVESNKPRSSRSRIKVGNVLSVMGRR